MTNVPKIVRDRLKAQPPVEHPDPNVLSAFAENSLLGRERASVLDHLSRCMDCREIVALALPAAESVQPILSPKPTSWLTWPALRWGVVAAGVVAIASFGVVRYAHENRTQALALQTAATVAKSEVPLPPESSANADKSFTHGAYPAPHAPVATPHERRQEPAAPTEAKPMLLTNSTIGGPILTRQPQSTQQSGGHLAGAPLFDRPQSLHSKDLRVPASNEAVEVAGANVKAAIAQNRTAPTQGLDSSEPAVAKSKDAEAPQANYAGAAATPSPNAPTGLVTTQLAETQLKAMPTPALWTVRGTGALQRSLDQGRTWQDVNVTASDSSSTNFYFAQSTAEVTANPAAKQSLKKNLAAPSAFRAVTSNGPDVWVGGSQGALYHSVDNGDSWTHVVPRSSGIALSGNVVTLDFPDPQHGKVTTSTSEVWATSDGGQTWQKQ